MKRDLVAKQKNIGLALSGGGVRAAVFHAGVLRCLAEYGLLESVAHISSVSGGSLFTGLVFNFSDYRWPTSIQYTSDILPKVRNLLTTKSLQREAIVRLILNPLNWRFILSRANVIAQSIQNGWRIKSTLDSLPGLPVWSINGTTAENGRRFRFKGITMGDYETGYADLKNFPLASAMAVSAAFPGGIGPLTLKTSLYKWHKRKTWDSENPAEIVTLEFKRLHLYDGGVYDNLGIEPLFDIGAQAIKSERNSPAIDFLLVSDAGAAFKRQSIPGPLNPFRLKRVMSVVSDQARSLRVRSLVNFLKNNEGSGLYLQIGSNPLVCIEKYAEGVNIKQLQNAHDWLSKEEIELAATYRTTLSKMEIIDFDRIERHGYETAMWNWLLFHMGK